MRIIEVDVAKLYQRLFDRAVRLYESCASRRGKMIGCDGCKREWSCVEFFNEFVCVPFDSHYTQEEKEALKTIKESIRANGKVPMLLEERNRIQRTVVAMAGRDYMKVIREHLSGLRPVRRDTL